MIFLTDQALLDARDELLKGGVKKVRSNQLADYIKKKHGQVLDPSTLRGRFIGMGQPLGGTDYGKNEEGVADVIKDSTTESKMPEPEAQTPKQKLEQKTFQTVDELKPYLVPAHLFDNYITRDVDKRLARAYDLGKYPLTQGKQGTGKTLGHQYYAWKRELPFFLLCCYEDFILEKHFGDRTIQGGDVKFIETEFTLAIQHPSVILFDEVNALSHGNTIQFNTLLQNRCIFIKDANNGKGRIYHLHPETRIGFAQNPKSRKYVGGSIRSSNFLGRCVHITYPEFTQEELHKAVEKKYPSMTEKDRKLFISFYQAILQCIEQGQIPIDISIRQLNNVIDLRYMELI